MGDLIDYFVKKLTKFLALQPKSAVMIKKRHFNSVNGYKNSRS